MRFAIFGVGAIGGYFGGRLAQAGEEVTFIARGEHLEALRAKGLRVDSINGDFVLPAVTATDDPSRIGAVDVVLVGVKTWQVPAAAESMRPLLGEDTLVLPLQNGVEAPAQLAKILGREHVCGGLAKIISYIAGPGHIRHTGAEPYIALGELDNQPSDRLERLRRALQRSGVSAEIPPDITAALWAKFLFVASWGGVGAITRAPIGVIRSVSQTRRMLEGSMQEIYEVADALNVNLAPDAVSAAMGFIDTLPPNGTTSMQRDIIENRPSEIESWTGAVVRFGRDAGVPVPINEFTYNSLLPLERKARGQLDFPE
ncbi:MAG: 2-dehydropantoate 2-reductase [Deltaproteobacteria bacterium]|jgi:2-dehydropantoate 2-reductase|nr:2-dehydropantoate 2-reductase [Deltaproteobacteria bacterium]